MKNLEILFENSSFLIVDKESGVSVHNDNASVVHQMGIDKVFPVHRLDKETSGLLVLAKTKRDATNLQSLFTEDKIKKKYAAIVFGNHSDKKQSDYWSQDLSARAGGVKNPKGPKPFVSCKSHYSIESCNDYFSFLHLTPLTGRTHQLRKHCLLNLAAIVGDSRYGKGKSNERIKKLYSVDRLFLHAMSLGFSLDGEEFQFSSKIPVDFNSLIPEKDLSF
ncbi:MAG: RluA family pseudouridine synthase [Bdellovibrionota bacterium]|nr:RluA family pseudouridine synthase [Bdellovibrionota bacterium]